MTAEADLEKLRRVVTTMREHQRAWFGGDKSPSRLDRARKAEREVDRVLAEIASPQKGLFG